MAEYLTGGQVRACLIQGAASMIACLLQAGMDEDADELVGFLSDQLDLDLYHLLPEE